MDAEQWRQYELAEWLGVTEDALSTYLKRHALPPRERLEAFVVLGCDLQALSDAELADRLERWIRSQDLDIDAVRRAVDRIEYERRATPTADRGAR